MGAGAAIILFFSVLCFLVAYYLFEYLGSSFGDEALLVGMLGVLWFLLRLKRTGPTVPQKS